MLSFVKIKSDDYKKIISLADRIWKKSFEDFLPPDRLNYLYDFMYGGEIVKQQIESGEQEYYIAEYENEEVAYYSIQSLGEGCYKLNKLYLLKEFHGKGIAGKIMDEIESIIKSKNGKSLMLTVNRANSRAISFYKKYGFEITGDEDFDVGGGHIMDDFIMELKLK